MSVFLILFFHVLKISIFVPTLGKEGFRIIYLYFLQVEESGTIGMKEYVDILKRLKLMRKEQALTQEKMQRIFAINQGQYSYIENGRTKMSGKMLEMLYTKGWNVDYLITGKDFGEKDILLKDQLMEFQDNRYQIVTYQTALVLWSAACKKENLEPCRKELRLLNVLMQKVQGETVFTALRKIENVNQKDMAESIGVNEKIFRAFEKEKRSPDAEILYKLHKRTKCRPSLFLRHDNKEWDILQYVWSSLDEEAQKKTVAILNENITYINEIEHE